jgi:hypothetical protein
MTDHHGSGSSGYETRDVNVTKIALLSLATIALLIVVVVFVVDHFNVVTEKIIEEVVLSPQSVELRELRTREAEELGSYKLLEAEAGRYRIPIERALQLMAEEAYARSEGVR